MSADNALREAFFTVMSQDLDSWPPTAPGSSNNDGDQGISGSGATPEVHAEILARLCLADALLEVLEWTRQGSAADPLACMWLGLLRWYRLIRHELPESAPVPPRRPCEDQLRALLEHGKLRISAGSAQAALDTLSSAEMGYPSSPAGPENRENQVLLRLHPIALVPYIDDQIRMAWVDQALALTHGDPQISQRARAYVADLYERASHTEAHSPDSSGFSDQPAHPLQPVILELAQRWQEQTAPIS